MAWLELHQSVRDHRKVVELGALLDLPEPHVVGHLAYLWLWAIDNAPDGHLPANPRTIARAAWWTGDATAFVEALVQVGLIDQVADGYCVHDWDEYIGKLIDQREANRERQRRHRDQRRTSPSPVTASNSDVTVTSALPNAATQPNPTEPNQTEETLPAPAREAVTPEAVQELFAAYCRGMGIRNGSGEWFLRQRKELEPLKTAAAAGMTPATLRDMAGYVRARWEAQGIPKLPGVAAVLEAESEFERWVQNGRPTDPPAARAIPRRSGGGSKEELRAMAQQERERATR